MKWMQLINKSLKFLIALTIMAIGIVYLSPSTDFQTNLDDKGENTTSHANEKPLSKTYDSLATHVLTLKQTGSSLETPDLRDSLLLYGYNARPDKDPEFNELHIGLKGSLDYRSINSSQKIYLQYEIQNDEGTYIFTPNNQVSSLWLETSTNGESSAIQVKMKGLDGQILDDPSDSTLFTPIRSNFLNSSNTHWEIDSLRVDGGFLARQKTRWFGKDLFIEKHGGEEFLKVIGKERLNFGSDDEGYSCYVGANDYLVWFQSKWNEVKPGMDTKEFPLLHITKIDDRMMSCDLWDKGGLNKMSLHLAKSMEIWVPHRIQQEFKFVGSRTRNQSIVEIKQKRITLSPQDWILRINDEWKKLSSEKDIDAYVDGQLTGELFIFNGVSKISGQLLMTGSLYNSMRTEVQPVEFPLNQRESSEFTSSSRRNKEWNTSETHNSDQKSKNTENEEYSLQLSEASKEITSEKKTLMRLPKVIRGNPHGESK
jgi:hypothetical protein